MKKIVTILLALALLVNINGCEAFRKKFTRKKKQVVKMPRGYQVKKYEKKPSPELYKKHFAYWESWQSELLQVLGKNHKKDMRCMEEIIGNLNDMRAILKEEKGSELGVRIEKLERLKDMMARDGVSPSNKDHVRMDLEREERFIRREFIYSKVKGFIREDFNDKEQ